VISTRRGSIWAAAVLYKECARHFCAWRR